MPSPTIDQPAIDHHQHKATLNWWQRQQNIIYSAILTATSAYYLLNMSDTASTKWRNAKWDKDVEVLKMMEFLADNASKAGDGSNFPATWYHQAAQHIAAFKGPDGEEKTGEQVETKYQSVSSFTHH